MSLRQSGEALCVNSNDAQDMATIGEFRNRVTDMEDGWYRLLGARIARLRKRADLTQEELAERAGIGASYVARIETGSRHCTLDVLGAIADALGLPLHRIVADHRAVKAAEGVEAWGRSGRALSAIVLELDDADIDLLLRVAQRMRGAT